LILENICFDAVKIKNGCVLHLSFIIYHLSFFDVSHTSKIAGQRRTMFDGK